MDVHVLCQGTVSAKMTIAFNEEGLFSNSVILSLWRCDWIRNKLRSHREQSNHRFGARVRWGLPSRAPEADLQVKPVYPLSIRVVARFCGFMAALFDI
jgi:hypothetical protein